MRFLNAALLATATLFAASSAIADANSDFLAANAKKPGVKTAANGLQYKVLATGKGMKPTKADCVTVNYKGTFIDGRVFDQSQPGQPISFPVTGVIAGWTEALEMMHVGDKWELTLPSHLAYGESGTPDGTIPPNSPLVFQVELLKTAPSQMGRCPR